MFDQKLDEELNVFSSLRRMELAQIKEHTCIRYIAYVIVMALAIENEHTVGNAIMSLFNGSNIKIECWLQSIEISVRVLFSLLFISSVMSNPF